MRGQVVSIALVVAAGVSVFVASVSTYGSLSATTERYYEQSRFAHIFVSLKRAPLSIVPRLSEIPGVAALEPRITRYVIADIPEATLPVSVQIVSLPARGADSLNRLHMRRGSPPNPGDPRGAVINEGFAQANRIGPGSEIRVLLGGRVQTFRVTGVALSAEYIFTVKPGIPMPDDRFFGVLWVDRSAAEAAFAMDGAFDDLAVSIAPGANPAAIIEELDRLLQPYGSLGAIERRDQVSNRFLEDELMQQRVMSTTVPFIFFGVAAFLINVALGRLVAAQREQIAALKALGFSNWPLAAHYLKFVAIVVAFGSALGVAGGWLFGVDRAYEKPSEIGRLPQRRGRHRQCGEGEMQPDGDRHRQPLQAGGRFRPAVDNAHAGDGVEAAAFCKTQHRRVDSRCHPVVVGDHGDRGSA